MDIQQKINEIQREIDLIFLDEGFAINKTIQNKMQEYLVEIYYLRKKLHFEIEQGKDKKPTMDEIEKVYSELINLEYHPNSVLNNIKNVDYLNFNKMPNVMLETSTGLLWPKMTQEFPYKEYSLQEKNRIMIDFELDGFKDWRLPNITVLKKFSRLRKFPYLEKRGFTINGSDSYWISGAKPNHMCNLSNVTYPSYELIAKEGNRALLMPYSSVIRAKESIAVEWADPKYILKSLQVHELTPILSTEVEQIAYEKFYKTLPKLLLELNALNSPTFYKEYFKDSKEHQLMEVKEFREIQYKEEFDEDKKSLLSYYPAAYKLFDHIIKELAETEHQKADLIKKINRRTVRFTYPPKVIILKSIYGEIVKYIKKTTVSPRDDLYRMLQDLMEQEKELKVVQTVASLTAIERVERPSFKFLKDYSLQQANLFIQSLQQYSNNEELFDSIINWYENLEQAIHSKTYDHLQRLWYEEAIEESTINAWIKEIEYQNMKIYELYTPFIADVLTSKLNLDIFHQIDTIFSQHIMAIENFYAENRLQIHQKFAFQVGGELQEVLETETDFYNLSNLLLEKFQKIVENREQEDIKKRILINIQPLLAVSIDRIASLLASNNEMKNILTEFQKLKRQQLVIFVEDTESFVKAKREREHQYNSLMYRMRKQLVNANK
ncbi:hypothetical protein B857_00929 [Solibacillus isronensis B3W22]|uniref:Uncharacterized protein n=1 Tax=Solibacillus isronensis B3W22 TaxID=1224748 RepID=K1KPG1_9BACL|nr:DUF1566 domain-containing protein [Solibacillus isronensis]AMO84334.1 hypothetical protein SOLI23_01775 [Solibacillus silvestris]EKB46035.1 hypothetical protein B857_00929 [Solibacillus isronensis B3W22]